MSLLRPGSILGSTAYLLFAGAICQSAAALDSTLEVTVDLYDYSGIHPAAMNEAQGTAGQILRQAGIEVRWRNCSADRSVAPQARVCVTASGDPTYLSVVVLPERMSRRIAAGHRQFGMAMTSGKVGFPTQAYIFIDRVKNLAQSETIDWMDLLGTVIAHEVGHLLLGENGHFPAGIMRADWRSPEIKQALMGTLTFTARQSEQMRRDICRRVKTVE